MKKIMYAGALLLALCFGLVTYSCSDDDDVTDFKSFVQGTWNAELVSVVDYKPSGEIYYTFTFKSDGTGYKVRKNDGNIIETFKYSVISFDPDSDANIDFYLDYTVIDADGNEVSKERFGGKKTGGRTWNLTSEGGFRTYYVMHKK